MSTIVPIGKMKKTRMILITGVTVAIVAVLITVGLYFFRQNEVASVISDELKKAASVMQVEKNKTGGYPATISGFVSVSDKVKLTGGGNFDGVSYCITGTSAADESVVFHVDSIKSTSDVLSGSCESSVEDSAPLVPNGLAVAFASSDSIKLTWNKATYAKSYTLQCSTSKEFDNPIAVEATGSEATCAGLKSDTAYYYRVKAINSAGTSAWSAESQFKTSKK